MINTRTAWLAVLALSLVSAPAFAGKKPSDRARKDAAAHAQKGNASRLALRRSAPMIAPPPRPAPSATQAATPPGSASADASHLARLRDPA